MKVMSKTDYIIYKGGEPIKVLIKGNVYEAKESFHNGYIVFDGLGEQSYFINDQFKKMFINAE